MTTSYSVPDTLEPADTWRRQALCGKAKRPDVMFPPPTDIIRVRMAKQWCANCPVIGDCARSALANREAYGVWGGLDEGERRRLLRNRVRGVSVGLEEVAAEEIGQRKPLTLQDIFDAGTTPLRGGHLAWTGKTQIRFCGQVFTPRQLCFFLDRGHRSEGRLMTDCAVSECVLPQHLSDTAERSRCGTRGGYQRHHRLGEIACEPCRIANTAADRRLSSTGTTKAAA